MIAARAGDGPKRRFLAPEVVQTSAMDCGPATLKALLDGFGRTVSFGRLREACQTDVDGTSIDTLEEVAVRLGLSAEQVMLPIDHLLAAESQALPAIVVVNLPDGATHFVVAWRVVGPYIQVMDPAIGRRWLRKEQFLAEVYAHVMPVPAEGWRAWAGSQECVAVLRRRLHELGIAAPERLLAGPLADPDWRPIAAFDAAIRLVGALVRSGGVDRGGDAGRLVVSLAEAGCADAEAIPRSAWSVRPGPPSDDGPTVALRGAVLVRVHGLAPDGPAADLPPELAAALTEVAPDPRRDLAELLRAGGLSAPLQLLAALLVATAGALVQTVLFRGLLEAAGQLGLAEQRLGGIGALALFALALLFVEVPLVALGLRLGRELEVRLRAAFLAKLPRLGDRYLQSRPVSDMAERSHSVHVLRSVPPLVANLARATFRLGATAAGLVWLDGASATAVVAACLLAVVVPYAVQRPLAEADLRFRTHGGSIARFYLDAMLGLVAIRTHGAEGALRRAHEELLTEWVRAGRARLGVVVAAETVLGVVAFGLSAWLFVGWLARGGDPAAALLFAYWALELPAIGVEIGALAKAWPGLRNVTLRLLEPLGALEEGTGAVPPADPGAAERAPEPAPHAFAAAPAVEPPRDPARAAGGGVAVSLAGVTVRAGGHTLLSEVDLELRPGEHVAVVGPSGAGKSTFVGLLLGWHRAAEGAVRVDGVPLGGDALVALRRRTAWVDPSVALWNRSFLDNLGYGNGEALDPSPLLEASDLVSVLQKLPDGLQHGLGEGGGLLSGGEGQRVRFARALGRRDARLVILDEPFRGLDRGKRQALLAGARRWWPGATLLCVTHDVSETLDFPRVLVIEAGRIVEDAPPRALAAEPTSRYRALLDTEEEVRTALWAAADWRRVRLEEGRVREAPRGGEGAHG